MAEELLEAQPLPHLFEQAQQIYLLASSSQVEPIEIRKACRMLQESQAKVETLALFSANEDKEDISTADLKYLLVCVGTPYSVCIMYSSSHWSTIFLLYPSDVVMSRRLIYT
jgi:hypothetical protein